MNKKAYSNLYKAATRYKNLSKKSGVKHYNINGRDITIDFKDGSVYEYNPDSTGGSQIRRMRLLARRGRGLNGYINRVIKKNYKQKIN